MTVYRGILHDTYTDEDGKEIAYEDMVIAYREGEVYHCVSVPEYSTFDMAKGEFLDKVTDFHAVFDNQQPCSYELVIKTVGKTTKKIET